MINYGSFIFDKISGIVLLFSGIALEAFIIVFCLKACSDSSNKKGLELIKWIFENCNKALFIFLSSLFLFFAVIFFCLIPSAFNPCVYRTQSNVVIEENMDNDFYKYKITSYDVIEYRTKKINGTWKNEDQIFVKKNEKIVYTDNKDEYEKEE